jgi:hypothetical protein
MIEDPQADLDLGMREVNEATPNQGKWCFRKTPLQTFLERSRSREKNLNRSSRRSNPTPHDRNNQPAPSVRSNRNFDRGANLSLCRPGADRAEPQDGGGP